ncbi:hypothetical protein L1887_38287 [Cichorium endivia]|nr:hypothetical protein L1887_38287 [Cichorium endivia]
MESDKENAPPKINPSSQGRPRSERILKKTALSKFKYTESNLVVVESDIVLASFKESDQTSVPKIVHTKLLIALAVSKKSTGATKSMDVSMQQPSNIQPRKSFEKPTHTHTIKSRT